MNLSKMQENIGLQCSQCNISFSSASSLLKHFAQHVISDIIESQASSDKRPVPNLCPIKPKEPNKPSNKPEDNGADSGFEDSLNPLTLCLVTMDAGAQPDKKKKFTCAYCPKEFGWSTDLKRHILTHTGQRPYNCPKCTSTFTRKSHLNKHVVKCHAKCDKPKIPALNPIDGIFKQQKGRKQDKSSIKKLGVSKRGQSVESHIE